VQDRDDQIGYPGAAGPDRRYQVDAFGLGIAVHEWGRADDPPLFLVHGGFDFARTFDVFAPKLAAGGWRVVSWDHRGHGDSDHAALYNWDADLRDALTVIDSVTAPLGGPPTPIVGHSKGGGLTLQLCNAQPHRFTHVVNIDGIPSRRPMPDVADHDRARMVMGEATAWLDYRRSTAARERRAGTLAGLAERRGRMNPRLDRHWLQYLVTVGARHDPDGWRWKLDPSMKFGGFGPWRPEWMMRQISSITVPLLGLLATAEEPMGWGTRVADLQPLLPHRARIEVMDGIGHFIHIEQPDLVAAMILDFVS